MTSQSQSPAQQQGQKPRRPRIELRVDMFHRVLLWVTLLLALLASGVAMTMRASFVDVLDTLIVAAISVAVLALTQFTHALPYPVTITEQNAQAQYLNAYQGLVWTALLIAIISALSGIVDRMVPVPLWVLVAVAVVAVIVAIGFIVRSKRIG